MCVHQPGLDMGWLQFGCGRSQKVVPCCALSNAACRACIADMGLPQEEKEWRLHERVRRKLEKTIDSGPREQKGVAYLPAHSHTYLYNGVLDVTLLAMH